MSFESYCTRNPILAKAQARKLYRHLKAAAIEILQREMKQATGRAKITIKRCIEALKDKL